MDSENMTKDEIVAQLKAAIESQPEDLREQVDTLKGAFYRLYNNDLEAAHAAYDAAEHEEGEMFVYNDPAEQEMKNLLAQYKTIRTEQLAKLEKEREANRLHKIEIIEKMKNLAEGADDVSDKLPEFKALQAEWKTIGSVDPMVANDLWKQYHLYQEQFYDNVKISFELRELDYKKNLETQTSLCQQAEALAERPDVVEAYRQLQTLHDLWKECGPVARELREDMWTRFKEASTIIYKKHQDFFDSLHRIEDENLQKKTELCEKLELIELDLLDSFKKWEEKTAEVLAVQGEWKNIGFAPRKVNQQIYDRYRMACDRFFAAKADYFKKVKAQLAENLHKKTLLCERAEEIMDSQEWKETTEKLVHLQQEWRKIGSCGKKQGDEVWARFQKACDHFFEQKKAQFADVRNAENDNLKAKKAIIEKIESMQMLETADATVKALKALMTEYNEVGHVPFREKDKLYKRYREAVDKIFDALHLDANQRRMDNFRANMQQLEEKGAGKLQDERRHLQRVYENLRNEIKTAENNIGFFTVKGNKPNPLMAEMERKINSLKSELKVLAEKIALLDEKIDN